MYTQTDTHTIKRNTHCNRNMIIVHVTLGTVHVSHRMLFSWLQIMTNTHSDLSQKGSGKHLTSAPGPSAVGTKRKQSEFVQKTRCKMFFFMNVTLLSSFPVQHCVQQQNPQGQFFRTLNPDRMILCVQLILLCRFKCYKNCPQTICSYVANSPQSTTVHNTILPTPAFPYTILMALYNSFSLLTYMIKNS